MALKNLAELVILWLHGRRLGIAGDGLNGSSSALCLDGIPAATTRAMNIQTVLGHNGAGAVVLAGTVVGDHVISATDLSAAPPADVTASFEGNITVAGQIQQSSASNLSTHAILFVVDPQS